MSTAGTTPRARPLRAPRRHHRAPWSPSASTAASRSPTSPPATPTTAASTWSSATSKARPRCDGLVAAYIEDSRRRGEPAALVPADLGATSDDRAPIRPERRRRARRLLRASTTASCAPRALRRPRRRRRRRRRRLRVRVAAARPPPRHPARPRRLAWLTLVAIHEAWRLGRPAASSRPGLFLAETDHERELPEPAGPTATRSSASIDREQHHAARPALRHAQAARAPRRCCCTPAATPTSEIAALTGSTYTAVNRRLSEGRARLHAASRTRGANLPPRGLWRHGHPADHLRAAAPRRLHPAAHLSLRRARSGRRRPRARFVFAMCLYAGAILNGRLPGPYRDADARAYARALLIPRELLDRPLDTPGGRRRPRRPEPRAQIARRAHRRCGTRRRLPAGRCR